MRINSFPPIRKERVNTLQVNLGYKCNQACSHCHVEASPTRTEMMNKENIDLIPKILEKFNIKTLDITGGAPELHPNFKELIYKSKSMGCEIIDRCNLTILLEPGYNDMPKFLAENKVNIFASLPCYLEDNVDKQRGNGVFKKSIEALRILNSLGYGSSDKNLILNLVYNPIGDQLPPPQEDLERAYKSALKKHYNVSFTNLITITNMPIKRFAFYLKSTNKLDSYINLLKDSFNKENLPHLMCKKTLSIDWQGRLFDCDFNQQLNINDSLENITLQDIIKNNLDFKNYKIKVDTHCFGCTAGSGSSCGGSLS